MRASSRIGDRWFDEQCRLDPVRAVLSGRTDTGFAPDYSPDGFAERAASSRAALRDLAGYPAPVLRERLEAEAAHVESGLAARLTLVTSPPMLLREALARVEGEARAALLAVLPAALTGYLATLRHETALGRPPNRVQAEVVAGATASFAQEEHDGSPAAKAAAVAYGEFADRLRQDVLPAATEDAGVGAESYAVAVRHTLGADPDLAGTREWLIGELDRLRAETDALTGGDLAGRCAELDTDPAWLVPATGLREWAQQRLDAAFDRAGRHLVVPEALRDIEVRILPGGAGPVHYLPPAADLSRPGRVCWPVPPGDDPVPVWGQVTMLHHEGVPGHHLQWGAAVLDHHLPRWQRHTTVPGHAEGWAVYAEGLLADQDAPRLGYLMGLRANAAVALVDLAVHAGLPMPGGAPRDHHETPEGLVAFLGEHTTIPEPLRHFTVLRAAAWPGQALAYSCGARIWQDARDRAERRPGFEPRAFHERLLGLGPCGLRVLNDAVR